MVEASRRFAAVSENECWKDSEKETMQMSPLAVGLDFERVSGGGDHEPGGAVLRRLQRRDGDRRRGSGAPSGLFRRAPAARALGQN